MLKELVKQIKLFIISIAVLLVISMLAVFYPVQEIMNNTLKSSFKTEAVITLTTLNNFIDTCSMETSSIATRPELRNKVIQYKRGKIGFSELIKSTTPCYRESCNTLQYCTTAVRMLDKRIVATYGESSMIDLRNLESHRSNHLTVVSYPYHGHTYFMMVCPVLDGDIPVAYDYVVYDPEPLLTEVNNLTHDYAIIRQADFDPGEKGITRIDYNLYEKGSSLFFHDSIKDSDAILIMEITEKELFTPVRTAIYQTLAIICLALLMTGIILYLTLYTSAREILRREKSNNSTLEAEKAKVEKLASGQRDLFNIFRYLSECWTLEDDFKVLKNSLPYIIDYRNFLMAVRPSRSAINFELKEVTGDYEAYNPKGLFGKDPGIMEEVLLTGHPCFTVDLPAQHLQGRYRRDVNSLIIVPIIYKGFVWGSISVDHLEKNAFTQLDFELMDMLASHIALHLEEMEAKRKLNNQAERLRSLHGLIGQMALERDNEAMTNRLLCDLLASLDLKSMGVYSLIRPVEEMNFRSLIGSGEINMLPTTQGTDLELLREVAANQVLKIVNQPGRGYLLFTPIMYRDVLHGIFCAVKNDAFTDEYIDVVWIIVSYLAIFWELNMLLYRTERDALIDPLTGVWNRRYMMKQIEIEDGKLTRSGGECCLAI
ncbi:MAG: GAF domain-containing protein, partial [Deltaproteobacteria bacterium]